MSRVDNADDVEGTLWLQANPLPVNHLDPTEPDVVSFHVEGSGGTNGRYKYLKRP